MWIFKRIGLFLLMNIAVLFVFSVAMYLLKAIFGIDIIAMSGQSYTGLLIFSAIYGFLGSFISLGISRWSAKRAYGITPIQVSELDSLGKKERLVYDVVAEIAQRHHIKMPEVGVYISQDPNAFATGASKNKSLVAVSTGLLELMNEREIEGVVAHEMAHILNGDMVTMTLLQGVMNTFVIFFARILAEIVNSRTDGKLWAFGYYAVYIGLQLILGILASVVVMAFSRHREFKADAGSANYVGKEKMIAALEALKNIKTHTKKNNPMATMQINSQSGWGWKKLFMSHPPLEARIQHLEEMRVI
jgi:heat shock protein HtpX